ncbi:DUF6541 family protein [Microbacterium esteraromaticum]|uniref:DUF6541 family protein n=1 Tax=Microbacterium esteraromaticum TaxID=57043 RepID=UPI001C9548DA|nr:DUF6541 family protein [Microbacterium esteraromaticum]MBY6060656.1 hypothetical protein [Microbacterium esteraromaticum]
MLEWLVQLPVLLVTAGLVFVPGVLALWFVGLRGLPLLASAPIFTVAATAVIALLLGEVGVGWGPLPWAAAIAALTLLAALVGRWAVGRLDEGARSPVRWLLPAAIGVGVAMSTWRVVAYVQDPSGVSQTNDAVFHMNAVRYILETDNASSLHVNSVIGGRGFYPAAWHAVVSMIVLLTGAEITTAANMLTLVIAAMIWPLGIAWLTRAVTTSSTVAAYAAVLSGALQTFPLLMFQWGVLFPNALSTAMIPAAVALVITVPRWIGATRPVAHVVRIALLILVAVSAILLAQPAAILPWMAISAGWVTFQIFVRRAEWGATRVVGALVVLWAVVGGVWLYLAQGTSGSHWAPFRGKLEVFLDVLFNGQVLIPFAFGISILMLIGLVVAARVATLRWFVFAWAGISALYLLVAAVGAPMVRVGLLGAWYADPYRIAALAPIVVIPIAAIGADAVTRAVAARMRRPTEPMSTLVGLAASVVFMIVLITVRPVAMPAVTQGTYDRESRYVAAADAYLNPDERELLESLDELVPADARVIGNPSTGSGFGYFLSGIDVYPRTWAAPRTPDWNILAVGLRDAATDPAVCSALMAYGNPQYVVDFGAGEDGPGRYIMPGMTDFAGQPGFELVNSVGDDASLWRITACAQ